MVQINPFKAPKNCRHKHKGKQDKNRIVVLAITSRNHARPHTAFSLPVPREGLVVLLGVNKFISRFKMSKEMP